MLEFDHQMARRRYRALRVQLHDEKACQLEACLGKWLMSWLMQRQARCVGFYWPIKGEPDLREALTQARRQGVVQDLAMPVIQSHTERTMRFATWSTTTVMRESVFGLLEVASPNFVEPDVIIAPYVAANAKGFRLGNGGGYYDRYLAKEDRWRKLETVAVGYEQLVIEEEFQRDHDIPFDWLLTEKGMRRTSFRSD